MARIPEGVFVRHQRGCPVRSGATCRCQPTYQAQIYDRVSGRRKTKSFATAAAARTWRQDAMVALRQGAFRPGRAVTIRRAGTEWVEGARAGLIHNRSGKRYKPAALRSYEDALRLRIYPALGPVPLADLRRSDLQRLVSRWLKEGLTASTIRNTLMPLRAIYKRALALDEVAVNPTMGLQLPAVRGRRERFASADEIDRLIAACPERDRALWATAFYAGLRRGELQALTVDEVDLASGVIRVCHGWDRQEGRIETKSGAGRRSVPIAAALRDELLEHKLRVGRDTGLMFGRTSELPFTPDVPFRRAKRAWERAGLEPIGLHECRHTFASLMIAAGVNAKALATYMGHSSVMITLDRYGHLMPGSEDEAAALLDAYLARATPPATKASIAG
jgi:integrase